MWLWFLVAYIYVRGEFYNEASNLQIAIREVSYNSTFFVEHLVYHDALIVHTLSMHELHM